MLLLVAMQGYICVVFLLPLYYLMDATIIIIKRSVKGEKIWQAHQQQFFHRSVHIIKRSHVKTTMLVIYCNIILICLALLSTIIAPIISLILGIIITSIFLKIMISNKFV